MTYKELKIKYPDKEIGEINIKRGHDYPLIDEKNTETWSNRNYSENAQMIDKGWEIFLNHSCDEWVIGTVEDAEQFQKDLAEAISYCKTNNG